MSGGGSDISNPQKELKCRAEWHLYCHAFAGVLGQVGSSGVLDHVDCSVGFRLQAPPAGARILSAGLRCALLNQAAAKRQPRTRSAFVADLGKLATADNKVNTACLPDHGSQCSGL